jgi:hypothetical protein
MSEQMAAEIQIGGKVRRSIAKKLCAVIARQDVMLDWEQILFRPASADDLLAARGDLDDGVSVLRLYDDRAAWGKFADLEAFLRKHRIPFRRYRESKYEYDATAAMYHPQCGFVEWLTNNNYIPFVQASELTPLADALHKIVAEMKESQVDAAKLQRKLQRLCGKLHKCLPPVVPALETFEIVEG